ncbi:transcription factor TFIID complex subunit 8 C-term-domain-containing protein, partial [Peziza echinospora]
PSKRRRRDPVPEPPRHPESAVIVPEDVAASLLDRANARILQSAGFSGATRLAQERLRELAEDYYLSMLETIALFAHAQRRTRPTAVDFQQMLTTNFISILSLEDELRRVPSAQPTPLPAPSPQSEEQRQTFEQPDTLRRLLGNELDGGNDQREYIPEYLPPFPSKHTYLETPVFTERPREPRIIREMATEEARLAENALRKILAAAVTGNTRAKTTNGVLHDETTPNGKLTKAQLLKRKNRDDIWEKTFN